MISGADIEKAAKAIGDQNGWMGCGNPCHGGEENPDCECFRYARAVLEAVGYKSKEPNAISPLPTPDGTEVYDRDGRFVGKIVKPADKR